MSYSEFVDFSWRVFDAAIVSAEILGWVATIAGGIGFLTTRKSPERHRRYRGLLYGGVAALLSVLLVGSIYEAITYIMTDETGGVNNIDAMYPDILIDNFTSDVTGILVIAGTMSQVAAIIGMSAFVFGAGFKGVVKQRSAFNGKSMKMIYTGIVLMMVSIMERIFAAGAYVLLEQILKI